jgi:anhydro-N-acetylmuramic acid kinase
MIKALGIMSGSSLDGVDIAYCEFEFKKKWSYNIIRAETIPYDEQWKITLSSLDKVGGEELCKIDIQYGKLLSNHIVDFITINDICPNFVSSHGHTVFHNPKDGYTLQIGNGQVIATTTGIETITDFRIKDIILGGQGAPLVPIGDELLFSKYDYCINIGGIANISYKKNNKRIAFDICPANQLLNHLSRQIGKPFDLNGNTAQLGKLDKSLFDNLNNHPYFRIEHPKSMSNQLVNNDFIPIVDESKADIADKLYTVCKHIAYQINPILKKNKNASILITGGGAHNSFLTNAIRNETLRKIIIPENTIIDFKEALIFAFMGTLNKSGNINCLSSATGAVKDCKSGVVYYP